MTYTYFWLTTGLACLFVLGFLSTATCLFLLRRLDRLTRSHEVIEQRLVQLAYEFRRLELLQGDLRRGEPRPDASAGVRLSDDPDSLISVPELSFSADPEASAALAEKHGEVWSLAEAGKSAQEIARETGRPIGQVELIVGLYRQHQAARSQGSHVTPS